MFLYLLLGTRYLMPFNLPGAACAAPETRVAMPAAQESCYFE
jgi:hypothetical protein